MPITPVTVQWVGSAADISGLLWSKCFRAQLEARWWYLALERSGLEDQFQFAYAVINIGGEPVGIAPAFRMDLDLEIVVPDALAPVVRLCKKVLPFPPYQRTWFVGSPCAEEGTVGLVPGIALAEVLPALSAALEVKARASKSHMIVWKDMPEAAAGDLRAYARQAKLFEVPSFPGTVVRRPGTSFETYLAALTAKRRYALKKKLSTSRASLDLSCEVVRSPDAATHREIWELFQKTYDKATVRFEKLTPLFFANIAEGDCVRYILLRDRATGRLVAFMLCYYQLERAINKFIGIDYDAGPQAFLYFRLWEEFVRWATAAGATELQSGQTSYSAKLDLGHELVPLSNFSRHLISPLNALYAFVGRFITWSTLDDDLRVHVAAQARKNVRRQGTA